MFAIAPRAGFYGVIDERFDIDLLREVAALRPGVQFVMLGPVLKIDAATLPQAANIHYLGSKSYSEFACVSCRVGCCPAAVRHQRCNQVYLTD